MNKTPGTIVVALVTAGIGLSYSATPARAAAAVTGLAYATHGSMAPSAATGMLLRVDDDEDNNEDSSQEAGTADGGSLTSMPAYDRPMYVGPAIHTVPPPPNARYCVTDLRTGRQICD